MCRVHPRPDRQRRRMPEADVGGGGRAVWLEMGPPRLGQELLEALSVVVVGVVLPPIVLFPGFQGAVGQVIDVARHLLVHHRMVWEILLAIVVRRNCYALEPATVHICRSMNSLPPLSFLAFPLSFFSSTLICS